MAVKDPAQQFVQLPNGGGAVQGLGETFAPDLHTGTGNVTVPLALPAGRNGLQPQLSVAYSTGQGNGPFGLGWALSVPGVARKTSCGVPLYNETASDEALDAAVERQDVFVLSGAEDLVKVDGGYPGVIRYRSRTETLFALIEHHRDPAHGDDYWRVCSKEGLVSIYGTPGQAAGGATSAALVDPADARRVFGWRLTETSDPFGNRIVYSYRRHGNQLYLEKVRYADQPGTDPEWFLVSVEFGFDTTPDGEVQERPDPFSTFRSGFEIRTALRYRTIEVHTHTDADRLFRRYQFDYAADASSGISLLTAVTASGRDDSGQEESLPPLQFSYSEFTPERVFSPGGQGRQLIRVTGAQPPGSLAAANLEMVDVFGNGLPDIVQIGAGASPAPVMYWRNAGDGRFALPRSMPWAPAGARLGDPGVQLLDADGDGRADLLITGRPDAGYYPLRPDARWSCPVRYPAVPSFDFNDPQVRAVDLDGDGISDVIRSGSRLECFFNHPDPDKAWRRTRYVQRRGLSEFPDVDFADPRVKWADMTGDGLQDIVYVHADTVEFWPNLGHGLWGPRRAMRPSVHLPDRYDPRRVLLGDVNGDGAADLIYVGDDAVTVWVNQSGNGFGNPAVIQGTLAVSDVASLRLVDLLGTGTAGLLWSAIATNGRPEYRFLDFTGTVKPYLLTRMANNLGAETEITYRSSVADYLRDQADPATRWRTTLPFPVQVVGTVITIDRLSGGRLTTEYAYRHGYWDGEEREFRGFGMVTHLDTERFAPSAGVAERHYSPPLMTKTWFHQGPVEDEEQAWAPVDHRGSYWPVDTALLSDTGHDEATAKLLAALPARVRRDALRALRGSMLRTELYAKDGHPRYGDRPYTVTETAYQLHAVLEGPGGPRLAADPGELPADWQQNTTMRRVFFPHAVSQRTTQWERGDDPLTTLTMTSGFDALGRTHHQSTLALPRRSARRHPVTGAVIGAIQPDETRILATHTLTSYAEPAAAAGETPRYLHDRIAQLHTFEPAAVTSVTETAPDDSPAVLRDQIAAAIQLNETFLNALDGWQPGSPPPAGLHLIGHTLHHYDGPAFTGRDDGQLERGALTRTETLVLTDRELLEAYGPEQRCPEYLGGPAALPPGAPAGFGQNLGYHRHDGTDPPYQDGFYADTRRQQFDFQAGGPPPHGLAAWPARGLRIGAQDGLGNPPTTMTPDAYWLLPELVRDGAGLVTTATIDYRTMQPASLTDPNLTISHLRYSPLGFPAAAWAQSRPDGQGNRRGGTAELPDTAFRYDLHAYADTCTSPAPQPVSVHSVRRVWYASDQVGDDAIETREYSDGFGRLLQTRTQAEDLCFGERGDDVGLPLDPAQPLTPACAQQATDRVIVSGWQVYDNKGRVAEKYEPAFAHGWDYQVPGVSAGVHAELGYDPRGNLIRTLNPDGSRQRVIYGMPHAPAALSLDDGAAFPASFDPTPWESYVYDANDLAPVSTDPDGASLAPLAPQEHHWTPGSRLIDALGRTICTIDRSGSSVDDWYVTTSGYDIRGNPTVTFDPFGRAAITHAYDLAGRPLRIGSIDSGVRTSVLDALGNLVESRDSKGAIVLHGYDALNRPSRLWARNNSAETRVTLRERIEYGDGGAPAPPDDPSRLASLAANRLGRAAEHWDEAGRVIFDEYDFTGNLTEQTRHVISDDTLAALPPDQPWIADWEIPDPESALYPSGYHTSSHCDALNRLTSLTYPTDVEGARRTQQNHYNRAGALKSITVGDDDYVQYISYNAKHQRVLIVYGNGLITRHAYDPRTFRLRRLHTQRVTTGGDPCTWTGQGPALQNYTYAYDLAGNMTAIDERVPGCGIRANPAAARQQDPAVRRLLSAGDALVREFGYDPLYRLTSATGRACKLPRAFQDIPGWGGYQTAQPVPGQENAPDLTESYTETYSYDPAGNMRKLAFTADPSRSWNRRFGLGGLDPDSTGTPPDNRLTSLRAGGDTFAYQFDGSGNLLQQNLERHHDWDHADRMTGYRVQNGAEPSLQVRFLYGADSLRVKKWVSKENAAASESSTTYISGAFEHCAWADGGATSHNSWIHVTDGTSWVGLMRIGPARDTSDTSPAVQYHLGDHLGSVALVAGPDVCWINREEYFAYGETSFGSYRHKRDRFGGRERDEESGLNYHGKRYYAPWLNRWTAVDPSPRNAASPYAFSSDNPMNYVDPGGAQAERASPLPAGQASPTGQTQAIPRDVTEAAREAARYTDWQWTAHQIDVLVPGPGARGGSRGGEFSQQQRDEMSAGLVVKNRSGIQPTNCTEFVLEAGRRYFAALGQAGLGARIEAAARQSRGPVKGTDDVLESARLTVYLQLLRDAGGFTTTFVEAGPSKDKFSPADVRISGTYPAHVDPVWVFDAYRAKALRVLGFDTPEIYFHDVSVPIDQSVRRSGSRADQAAYSTFLRELASVPFAVGTVQEGNHGFVVAFGVVYTVKWDASSRSAGLFKRTPVEAFLKSYRTAVIAIPTAMPTAP